MHSLTRNATASDESYKRNDFPMRRGVKMGPLKWYFFYIKIPLYNFVSRGKPFTLR